jgi:hypothetical protein
MTLFVPVVGWEGATRMRGDRLTALVDGEITLFVKLPVLLGWATRLAEESVSNKTE